MDCVTCLKLVAPRKKTVTVQTMTLTRMSLSPSRHRAPLPQLRFLSSRRQRRVVPVEKEASASDRVAARAHRRGVGTRTTPPCPRARRPPRTQSSRRVRRGAGRGHADASARTGSARRARLKNTPASIAVGGRANRTTSKLTCSRSSWRSTHI